MVTTSEAARRLARAGCVAADEEAAIMSAASATPDELSRRVARREAGEPLAFIVGRTQFRGLSLAVDAGVFVPRPRSEFLVEEAASLVRCLTRPERDVLLVDLCCGVGAVGAALAAELSQVRLHAVDVDPRAVACAQRNVGGWGGVVHQGDLFSALPRRLLRRTDVIVASPPYVPTAEIPLLPSEARHFEPLTALDGGANGLQIVARIARGASRWLAPGGCLALEVGTSQVDALADLLGHLGYGVRTATSEEYGSAVVVGRT